MTNDDARRQVQIDSMMTAIRGVAFDLWDACAERNNARLNADDSMLFAAGIEAGMAACLSFLRDRNLLRPLE